MGIVICDLLFVICYLIFEIRIEQYWVDMQLERFRNKCGMTAQLQSINHRTQSLCDLFDTANTVYAVIFVLFLIKSF